MPLPPTNRVCHVTGATGFIGSKLCAALANSGSEVAKSGREHVRGDTLQGVQVLVHCAGVAHQEASEPEHEAGNYSAVLAQAEAAQVAGVERFIFLSTVKAAEDAGAYGYWKWRAERALEERFGNSAMQVINLRPALVYGPGAKGNLATLIRGVKRGLPAPPHGGSRSMIGLPDLCELIGLLVQQERGESITLTATDGEQYDLRRMHDAIRAGLHLSPSRAWLPRSGWRLACWLLDLRQGGTGEETYYEKLFGEELYSNALSEWLPWQPRQRFEDVVADMLAVHA